ncbi:carbohydrate ABC transporter permease [Paenibacillus beijingensis]|uniref:ABC transporter permease n=1 Tax=Paenibacillus beijingensis TaxID=1126833 RepID=A0A0D5NGP1_9BACL|nr:sugar ABC transporter permease [Paenibacillus beijingensis]AJY74088.1 ABC transporter permease [Paenibacillus beijingensis]
MNNRTSEWAQQLLFMGPAVVLYTIVMIIPFLLSLYYSLTDWNGVSGQAGWIGFDNYYTILANDDRFIQSFWFTAKIMVVITVLTNVLGFALAYLLVQKLKLRNAYRTIFFIPNVLGGLVLGFVWKFIFTKGFAALGELTGLSFFKLAWLGTETTAFWGIVMVSVWQGIGYVMVIYIAGLSNLPGEVREAALLDGATPWHSLTRIVLPLMMPSITVCLFFTINGVFKMYDVNYSLTGGGPYNSSESVAMNIFIEAFTDNNYGLGSAKAILLFAAVVIITSIQVYWTKKREVSM